MVTVKGPVSENLFTSPKKWAIPEKKSRGVEDTEFPGVLKK